MGSASWVAASAGAFMGPMGAPIHGVGRSGATSASAGTAWRALAVDPGMTTAPDREVVEGRLGGVPFQETGMITGIRRYQILQYPPTPNRCVPGWCRIWYRIQRASGSSAPGSMSSASVYRHTVTSRPALTSSSSSVVRASSMCSA